MLNGTTFRANERNMLFARMRTNLLALRRKRQDDGYTIARADRSFGSRVRSFFSLLLSFLDTIRFRIQNVN